MCQKMTRAEIVRWLEKKLNPQLFRHSIATEAMSLELAEIYDVDSQKASLAGLVHDCAKCMSNKKMLLYARRYNIPLDQIQLDQPFLLHAPVGAKLAQMEFGIEDEDILHAVEVHCIGSTGMSRLDKIIYVADASEPNRDYYGVQKIRELAYGGDLNGALLEAMELKITYVIEQKLILHPLGVEARNEILTEIRNRS